MLKAETAIQAITDQLKRNGRGLEIRNKYRTVLTQIANNTDLFNPEAVKEYIATMKRKDNRKYLAANKLKDKPISIGTKRNFAIIYGAFIKENGLKWRRPIYKYEAPTVIIPRTEDINQIIGCSSKEAIPCFMIMKETAIEATELHNTGTEHIDTSKVNAVISVIGVKQHDNNVYYLSTGTSDMLRALIEWRRTKHHKHGLIQEMQKNPELYPFPAQNSLNTSWIRARRQAVKKYAKPELENIELKDLRNYAGAVYYLTYGRDTLATKKFMRHKKAEQTENYLKGIKDFALTSNKVTKIASTPTEIVELINAGFKEEAVYGTGTPLEKHILSKCTF
jgi:integrase